MPDNRFGTYAVLEDPVYYDGRILHLIRPGGPGRRLILNRAGAWIEVASDGSRWPEDAGIMLPGDSWAAIAALVEPKNESLEGELRATKEALAVERSRVDRVLER